MFKTMRASLVDLKDIMDETLGREFNKLSEKGANLSADHYEDNYSIFRHENDT